eukprot:310564-Prymnesium_polylepis.1
MTRNSASHAARQAGRSPSIFVTSQAFLVWAGWRAQRPHALTDGNQHLLGHALFSVCDLHAPPQRPAPRVAADVSWETRGPGMCDAVRYAVR